jgi:hypothetical protein
MSDSAQHLNPPAASRQVAFHQLLQGARQEWLVDGLRDVLSSVSVRALRRQLGALVPQDVARILAAAGVREEYVFPTPAVLEAKPPLLGYYRLLLGHKRRSTGQVPASAGSRAWKYEAPFQKHNAAASKRSVSLWRFLWPT